MHPPHPPSLARCRRLDAACSLQGVDLRGSRSQGSTAWVAPHHRLVFVSDGCRWGPSVRLLLVERAGGARRWDPPPSLAHRPLSLCPTAVTPSALPFALGHIVRCSSIEYHTLACERRGWVCQRRGTVWATSAREVGPDKAEVLSGSLKRAVGLLKVALQVIVSTRSHVQWSRGRS